MMRTLVVGVRGQGLGSTMRSSTILLALFSSLAVGSTACKALECGEGTVERNGDVRRRNNDRTRNVRPAHRAARRSMRTGVPTHRV